MKNYFDIQTFDPLPLTLGLLKRRDEMTKEETKRLDRERALTSFRFDKHESPKAKAEGPGHKVANVKEQEQWQLATLYIEENNGSCQKLSCCFSDQVATKVNRTSFAYAIDLVAYLVILQKRIEARGYTFRCVDRQLANPWASELHVLLKEKDIPFQGSVPFEFSSSVMDQTTAIARKLRGLSEHDALHLIQKALTPLSCTIR